MDDTNVPGDLTPPPPPPPVAPGRRRSLIGRRGATAALAGGLVVGGVAGGYMITQAATTGTPTPSVTAPADPGHGGPGGGGPAARTEDLQQAAAVIGISETDLQTALSNGQTIAAVAVAHSKTAAAVISTLVTDENAEIDAAASSGRITAAQATQEKTQTTQRVTDFVNGTRPPRGPGGPGGPGGRGGMQAEDQQVVATALGITTAQLQTEETAGKTIAAIAAAHNVSVSKVIDAWVASENSEIDQQVTSGNITAAQGADMKTHTTQRVTDEVNGTRPAGGPGGPRDHDGPAPSTSAPSGAAT
jgi:hypothetical protein